MDMTSIAKKRIFFKRKRYDAERDTLHKQRPGERRIEYCTLKKSHYKLLNVVRLQSVIDSHLPQTEEHH